MGNAVGSFFSGSGQVLGAVLGHPLDFLSGASCNSVCGPTWDFTCYIENFCISHLLKLGMVAALVYFVVLFFYPVYKLGICQCICHTCCRFTWACFATCFSFLDFCCTYLCYKLRSVKRKRRRRKSDIELAVVSHTCTSSDTDLEEIAYERPRSDESTRTRSAKRLYCKEERLRRSLRPTSHRARVSIAAGNSTRLRRRNRMGNVDDHISTLHHHVRVGRSSRFANKGLWHRNRVHHRRRL